MSYDISLPQCIIIRGTTFNVIPIIMVYIVIRTHVIEPNNEWGDLHVLQWNVDIHVQCI